MSIFGFESAVTTQGNFGAGVARLGDFAQPVEPCTLAELCGKVDILLNSRGFRREIPSRKDILDLMSKVYVEVLDVRREIERLKKQRKTDGYN